MLHEYKIIFSSDGSDGLTKARSESSELVLRFKLHLEAFREGADDVLRKPIRAEELLARVNSKFLRVDESKKVVTTLKAADSSGRLVPRGVTVRTVDTHMTSLRKKIENSGVAFSTLYGAGYILKEKIGKVSGRNEGETPLGHRTAI